MKVSSFLKKNLPKWLGSFLVIAFPLLFVWMYNGIWHGSSWKYIFYGLYYYFLIMSGILFKPLTTKLKNALKLKEESKLLIVVDVLRTTLLVVIGMLIFRSKSLVNFFTLFKNMFAKGSINIYAFDIVLFDLLVLAIYVIILFVVGLIQEKHGYVYDKLCKKDIVRYIVFTILIIGIIVLGVYGEGYDASNFIYGQF
jgi:D-alanyl-lipoteichoic acid acyltransferase DltB (MBOAT superfamily)